MPRPGHPADSAGPVEPAGPAHPGGHPRSASAGYPPPVDPWAETDTETVAQVPAPAAYPSSAPRRNPAVVVLSVVLLAAAVSGAALLGYHLAGDRAAVADRSDETVVGGQTPDTGADDDVPELAGGDGGRGDDDGPDGSEDTVGDRLGLSADRARAGDCLVNDGTDRRPVMRIVRCDTDEEALVYHVLERFPLSVTVADGDEAHRAASVAACESTPGYRYHYYSVQDDPRQSFVLCLSAD